MTEVAIRIPGDWPTISDDEVHVDYHLKVPRIDTQIRGQRSVRTRSSKSSSSAQTDELFFDTPLTPTQPDNTINGPPYLVIDPPEVESVLVDESADWIRYEPPVELLHVHDDLSDEVRELIPQSIERLRVQQVEEAERRAIAIREKRPLTRSRRASIRPRRMGSTEEVSHPLVEENDPEAGNQSATSLLSTDSGYGSASPENMSIPAIKTTQTPLPHDHMSGAAGKEKQKSGFSLTSLFRKRNNRSHHTAIEEEPGHPSTSKGTALASMILEQSQTSSSREAAPTFAFKNFQPSTANASSTVIPMTSLPETLEPDTTIRSALVLIQFAVVNRSRECVSCLDDFEGGEMIKLTCHSYCTDCFQRLMNTALASETHWPPKCCLNTIAPETILPHLDSTMTAKYNQRSSEWSVPTSDRIYCSHQPCTAWIPPSAIKQSTQTAKCPLCAHKTCTSCRGPSHSSDCPQDPSLQQTITLAEQEGWKRCYSCRAFVEHNTGCRHMTCRCRAEFCYICGERWRTCGCTDAQLVTAQQEVVARRRVREEADRVVEEGRREREREEEEVRVAVRMVEEFERAEAVRAAALVEEQRLRDEEERIRREEERQRIEEERIAGIGERFRGLGAELQGLSEEQGVLMGERWEFEAEVGRKESQDLLDAMSLLHKTESSTLASVSRKAVREAEQLYKAEYRLLVLAEQRVEQDYMSQLQMFWVGKSNNETIVEEKINELREDQEKEYRIWKAIREKQLYAVREGEKRKTEAMMRAHVVDKEELNREARRGEEQRRVKRWAEEKWVRGVERVRVEILGEMEMSEYAGGMVGVAM